MYILKKKGFRTCGGFFYAGLPPFSPHRKKGEIKGPQYHSAVMIEGFRAAQLRVLNCAPMMPRGTSLWDSGCNFF